MPTATLVIPWALGVALVSCGSERVAGVDDRPRGAEPSGTVSAETLPRHDGSVVGLEGRWARLPDNRLNTEPIPQVEQRIAELEAIGYLAGTQTASEKIGVVTYRVNQVDPGVNLYNSGHAEMAALLDMEGRVLHRWSYSFERAFPELVEDLGSRNSTSNQDERWRRVYLFPDGELLAIYEGLGLIRIDKDSRLIWSRANKSHHDLWVAEDGRIFVLTREAKVLPRLDPRRPILEDYVSILTADGDEIRRISLIESFENSDYRDLFDTINAHGDLFHTNTLEIFDGSQAYRSPLFRAGNALVSMRTIDRIAIVDLDREKVVWSQTGDWKRQHQPTLLANGNILLFDNEGESGNSKVIEFDPLTDEVSWAYVGDEGNGFYSRTCGSNQRLSNGNTLITESDFGRAFEVTPAGEIVWEFHNPARAGERGELVATLFELMRLPADFPLDWVDSPGATSVEGADRSRTRSDTIDG